MSLRLTGQRFPKHQFRVIEDQETANMDVLEAMLNGEGELNTPIYIVRNYLAQQHCDEIRDEFFQIINQTSGGNRIEDLVKVYQVGATQFKKTTDEYFAECRQTRLNIDRLLHSISSEEALKGFMLESFFEDHFSKKNIRFGPSMFNGQAVNPFTARLWNNTVGLSLLAHEDLSQLKVANQENYDIGNVKTVIANNLCIHNEFNSKLILWNIAPDEEVKNQLDLASTGYPYPLESLEGIDHLMLETRPGDLYFINANHVHAVTKEKQNQRITLGRFIGRVSPVRIEYWT